MNSFVRETLSNLFQQSQDSDASLRQIQQSLTTIINALKEKSETVEVNQR